MPCPVAKLDSMVSKHFSGTKRFEALRNVCATSAACLADNPIAPEGIWNDMLTGKVLGCPAIEAPIQIGVNPTIGKE
jgi:hypothetical protein